MLICLPYHSALPVNYADLAKSIIRVGTNPNHTLAVISLRSDDEGAFHFSTSLSDYFGRHIRSSMEDQPEQPMMTANRFYLEAVRIFKKYKPSSQEAEHSPMMIADPTYQPVTPRWLDELQSDYFRSGAPRVFGNFKETEPPMTVGPLILSREFVDTCTLADFLPPNVHWRNYLAWELLKSSVKAAGIGSHDSAVLAPQFNI